MKVTLAVFSTKNFAFCVRKVSLTDCERRNQKDGGNGEEERVASSILSPLLAFNWPVSLLTKQPGWSLSAESLRPPPPPHPPAPEPSFSASFLFVWLKTWPFQSQAAHWEQRRRRRRRRRGRKAQERGTEGRLAGRRQRETLNTPELGLIYFINRDYKFNLQTRGQNFSLTRGPWRTSGPGDHSYY